MRCPICDKSVQLTDPFMPFCSDRCRVRDLGKWASEEYRIPAPLDPEELEGLEERRQGDEDGE